MKKLIFIFLLFPMLLNGATYYVSNSGNDTYAGTSPSAPWKTIAKVNSYGSSPGFSAGDNILFQRGGTWYETLTVTNSGSSGNRITYGAYGSGAKPKISGFTTVSGWSLFSGSIYCASVSATSPNLVTIDNVNTPMGRYPNSNYPYRWQSSDLTIDSYTSNSITDGALPVSPDLDGAEIVIRVAQWITETRTVNHNSHTLTLTSGNWYYDSGNNGRGYFLRNHLSFLDSNNEWYYGGGYLYVYGNPNSKVVKISARATLVSITNKSYITLENLCLEGANSYAINAGNATYLTVDNCDILYGGNYGISAEGTCTGLVITNNTISNINNYGIDANANGPTIEYNDISYIGYINGAGGSGDEDYTGIVATGDNTLIRYNRIVLVGYDGIRFGGQDTEISYNYIDYACMNKSDGAGVYAYRDSNTGKSIHHNIIMHCESQVYGWPYYDYYSASGIYTDGCEQVSITDNIFAHSGNGMYINCSRYITTEDNLCYNNFFGMWLMTQSGELATNHSHTGNIYFSRYGHTDQYCVYIVAKELGESYLYNWGTSDYNYFICPINNDNYIRTLYNAWDGTTSYLNLAEWRSASGKDAHSSTTPVTITSDGQLHFIYNDSFETKYYTIIGTLKDYVNNSYTTSTTLAPFTGKVLIGTGSVTEVVGGGATVNTTPVSNISATTASGGGNVTDDGGYPVTARGVCWSTSLNPTTANPKTSNGTGEGIFVSGITGLQPSTKYYVRAYATNSEGTAYGGNVEFTTLATPPPVEYGIITHNGEIVKHESKIKTR